MYNCYFVAFASMHDSEFGRVVGAESVVAESVVSVVIVIEVKRVSLLDMVFVVVTVGSVLAILGLEGDLLL